MIKSVNYLKPGDIIFPVEMSDNAAVVLRTCSMEVEIMWCDYSIGRIQEKDLVDFSCAGYNIAEKLWELKAWMMRE